MEKGGGGQTEKRTDKKSLHSSFFYRTDVRTNERKISPFYRTLFPTGAAALPQKRKLKSSGSVMKLNGINQSISLRIIAAESF